MAVFHAKALYRYLIFEIQRLFFAIDSVLLIGVSRRVSNSLKGIFVKTSMGQKTLFCDIDSVLLIGVSRGGSN